MTSLMRLLAVAVILMCGIQLSFAQTNLTITSPKEGSSVPQYGSTVTFNSKAPIGATLRPVVFLKDPNEQWWPWLTAVKTDNTGRMWKLAKVQFGSDEDQGLPFQIQVLVIPKSKIDDGLTVDGHGVSIEAGTPLKNNTFKALKAIFTTQSAVVNVTRQ